MKIVVIGPTMHNYVARISERIKQTCPHSQVTFFEYKEFKAQRNICLKAFLYPFWRAFRLSGVNPFFVDYEQTSEDLYQFASSLKKIDTILLIKGYGLNAAVLQLLKQKTNKLYLYRWDAVHRFPEPPFLTSVYDKLLSTSPSDHEAIYCPLPLLERVPLAKPTDQEYKVVHVGQFDYWRALVAAFIAIAHKRTTCKLVLTNCPFDLNVLQNLEFKKGGMDFIETISLYSSSEFILDILRPSQDFPSTRLELAKHLRKKYLFFGTKNIQLKDAYRINLFGGVRSYVRATRTDKSLTTILCGS